MNLTYLFLREVREKEQRMINRKLIPLKVTLFGFAGAAFAVLPYLTIHMKDIGIRLRDLTSL